MHALVFFVFSFFYFSKSLILHGQFMATARRRLSTPLLMKCPPPFYMKLNEASVTAYQQLTFPIEHLSTMRFDARLPKKRWQTLPRHHKSLVYSLWFYNSFGILFKANKHQNLPIITQAPYYHSAFLSSLSPTLLPPDYLLISVNRDTGWRMVLRPLFLHW